MKTNRLEKYLKVVKGIRKLSFKIYKELMWKYFTQKVNYALDEELCQNDP